MSYNINQGFATIYYIIKLQSVKPLTVFITCQVCLRNLRLCVLYTCDYYTYQKMVDEVREIDDDSICLVSKPKTSSAVWNYFEIKSNNLGNPLVAELEKPVCKLCEKSISSKGSNTSNLLKHLESNHPEAFSEARKATSRGKGHTKQPAIEETNNRIKTYNADSSRAQELNPAVASFITSEMQPYQIVEKPGFKKMIKKLDPKYYLPTQMYFSNNEIPHMYSKMVEKVKEDTSTIKYFATTTDLWTINANHLYLSCTIHFIDEMWELKSYYLDTVPLFADHTGTNLSETLQDILSNWGLDASKLVATTTDN